MGQPHDRSSKRSAAEAVEEQQEAGETLLEKDQQPADEPGGGDGRRPSGPGQPVGQGARLVVDPGRCQCFCLHSFRGTVSVLSPFHASASVSAGDHPGCVLCLATLPKQFEILLGGCAKDTLYPSAPCLYISQQQSAVVSAWGCYSSSLLCGVAPSCAACCACNGAGGMQAQHRFGVRAVSLLDFRGVASVRRPLAAGV